MKSIRHQLYLISLVPWQRLVIDKVYRYFSNTMRSAKDQGNRLYLEIEVNRVFTNDTQIKFRMQSRREICGSQFQICQGKMNIIKYFLNFMNTEPFFPFLCIWWQQVLLSPCLWPTLPLRSSLNQAPSKSRTVLPYPLSPKQQNHRPKLYTREDQNKETDMVLFWFYIHIITLHKKSNEAKYK